MKNLIFISSLLFYSQSALAVVYTSKSLCEAWLNNILNDLSLPLELQQRRDLVFIPPIEAPFSATEWQQIDEIYTKTSRFDFEDDSGSNFKVLNVPYTPGLDLYSYVFDSPLKRLLSLVRNLSPNTQNYLWSSLNFNEYRSGQYIELHTDHFGPKDIVSATTITAIIFLNDDYLGGELNIHSKENQQSSKPTEISVSFKPPAHSILIMLGQPFHSTNMILRGTKNSIAVFFHPLHEFEQQTNRY